MYNSVWLEHGQLNKRTSLVIDKIELWLGDSRGHWEGNTLVVETTNVNGKVFEPRITVFGVGKGVRLIERFTRTSPDTIDYQFTVHNPSVYTGPWTTALPMTRIQGRIYEYACHEGNYALPNILSGARFQEKAAARGTAK